MAENNRKARFTDKYQGVEKIWCGPSFIQYHEYRTVLSELPVSEVATPSQTYGRQFRGNLDYVYGEMLYSLTGFEGFLRDKAFKVQECCVRPLLARDTYILRFDIRYLTKEGQEATRAAEVLRLGETQFIFYTDYHRPM
jgi:hypothetical protein